MEIFILCSQSHVSYIYSSSLEKKFPAFNLLLQKSIGGSFIFDSEALDQRVVNLRAVSQSVRRPDIKSSAPWKIVAVG
jgi:hypothetical protein